MEPGELIAGRFRLERRAGAGVMGEVFQAIDLSTGAPVATVLMGDQMRRAFEDLLAAETAAGPLLFVLEDLH